MLNLTNVTNISLIPDEILNKLILLYGYNFDLQKQIKTPLNPSTLIYYDNIYTINIKWITKFKEFYNYKLLSQIMYPIHNFKSYDDFEKNINALTNIIKSYKLCQKDKDFQSYIHNIPFFPEKNYPNINYSV